MTPSMQKRGGYSLIEMLCILGLLIVVLGVLGLLLNETFGLERSQGARFERMAQHQALADQFRADVAQAVQAPAAWKDSVAGPQTLILQLPTSHVVYRWQAGALERQVYDGGENSASRLGVDGDHADLEFVRDGPATGLVRLRIQTMRNGAAAEGQTLEIAAALGGDWR